MQCTHHVTYEKSGVIGLFPLEVDLLNGMRWNIPPSDDLHIIRYKGGYLVAVGSVAVLQFENQSFYDAEGLCGHQVGHLELGVVVSIEESMDQMPFYGAK